MSLKSPSLLLVAFAAGFVIAWGVASRSPSKRPSATGDVVLQSPRAPSSDAMRADYERQISELKAQLELAKLQSTKIAGMKLPVVPTTEARIKAMQELRHAGLETAQKLETDRLLAAGFSAERIEWLKRRTEELEADFRRQSDLLRQQGKLDMDAENAFSYDSDIVLRKEIGDDEYAKYRQALGRPIGVQVSAVLAGGGGDTAGIKPGDQITSYNGTRVFNMGELIPLLRQTMTSPGVASLDVLRNGESVKISASRGDLRIRSDHTVMATSDLAKMMDQIDASRMETAKGSVGQ